MPDSLEKKVDRILFYLENDPSTGTKGLVEKVACNQKNVETIKNEMRTIKKIATFLGAVGSAFGYALYESLKFLFK